MISVIICSIDEAKFAAVDATYRRLLSGGAFEIIRIADARSMCEGYNRGVGQSRGEVIIFSHDDIEIHARDFRDKLLGHLDRCDVAGVAGTTLLAGPAWAWAGPPHVYGQLGMYVRAKNFFDAAIYAAPGRQVGGMQALDGVFLACHRKVVEATPFDEQTFTAFHHYDLDCTYRAFRAGMKLAVCCDLDLIHFSFGDFGSDAWKASAARFMQKHAATIPQQPLASWNRTSVRVQTREQLLPCLHPPHWDD
jgi:GT2 family glycosyltransferase